MYDLCSASLDACPVSEDTRVSCAMNDPMQVRDARWSYGPDGVHAVDVATVRAYQNAAFETDPEAADLVAIGLAHYQAVYGQIKREAEADTLEMAMED